MSEHNITGNNKKFVEQELQIRDNSSITLGTTGDITIKYDEITNDALEFSANVDTKPLNIILKADQGDNEGDSWKLSVADGGNLTLGNDIAIQNTFATHLTIVPNATPASSTTTVAGNLSVGGNLSSTGGVQSAAVARTATLAGDGTAVIPAGTTFVDVTSENADHIITLPTPVLGNIIYLMVGSNGYELRAADPENQFLNGVKGAGKESAVNENTLVRCICTVGGDSGKWVANTFGTDGTEAKLAAPDN